MPWKRRPPYQYNRAEWWGVFLALIGTPALLYQLLGSVGILPSSMSSAFVLFYGGIAGAGWTLLVLGTRAHRRANRPTTA